MNARVGSSQWLPAGCAAGGSGIRELASVINCMFFAASARVDPPVRYRPLALGLALSNLAALSGRDSVGQARHRRSMAP